MTTKKIVYIKGFDGLRAVSIVLVLMAHLGLFLILPENDFWQKRVWGLCSGRLGVNVFFTLSGFLITMLLLKEKDAKGKVSFKNFYIRRFLRLMPPLLLFYATVAIMMYFNYLDVTVFSLLISMFYGYNFVPKVWYYGELGHTWSLSLEEQFYLVWPWVVNFLSHKKMMIAALSIVLMCLMALYALPKLTVFVHRYYRFEKVFYWHRWFLPAVGPVMIGAMAAIIKRVKITWIKQYVNTKQWQIMAVLMFFAPLYFPIQLLAYVGLVQAVAIAMLLLWLCENQSHRFIIPLLHNKPMVFLGKISYSLYIWQGLFLRTGPGGELTVQQLPLNIVLTFGMAIASYYLIEKKALAYKKYFT